MALSDYLVGTVNNYLEPGVGYGGKIDILLLDIKDNFNPPSNRAYTGGYFHTVNYFHTSYDKRSNGSPMLYIDTNPGIFYDGKVNLDNAYRTIAHEMQHLMNFVNSMGSNIRNRVFMDTWVNEGLSGAAEWVYAGNHENDRMVYYNDENGNGDNFFVWDNSLIDYATVYLFFQWLRIQSGKSYNALSFFYKSIIKKKKKDHEAVVGAMGSSGYSDWPSLLKDWLAANYINASSGRYGYCNDPELKDVKAKTLPSGKISVSLRPGEGVYSKIDPTFVNLPSNVGKIRYVGLDKMGSGSVNDTNVFPNGWLLTYNENTAIGGSAETGTTTGVSENMGMASGVQSVSNKLNNRPYVHPEGGDVFQEPFPYQGNIQK
jgi:hypothetical protein